MYPRTIETLQSLVPSRPLPARHALDAFDFPSSMWQAATRTLCLFGASGVGKTSLAMALLPQALKTKHLDLLRTKKYPSNHFGIIYDEGNLSHLHQEAQIAFLDREFDTEVHVRYGVAEIPAGHPVIITSNRRPDEIMALWNPAVQRRVDCVLMLEHNRFTPYLYSEPTGLKAGQTLDSYAVEREKEQEFDALFN